MTLYDTASSFKKYLKLKQPMTAPLSFIVWIPPVHLCCDMLNCHFSPLCFSVIYFFSCDSSEKVRGFLNHPIKVCLQLYLLSLQTESTAPLGMMQHGTGGFGGREPYHLFAKTNGIITPICYIKAGPTSTCLKHCMLLTLTWVMIKLFLVYLVLNKSTLNLWT